ncbi:MAG: poly-gamma-glutamate hydrolase family protein [Burkholderiaceae bacterium]|nr:poly-gamma-glutamate hydrolase family protein [Burkholderiaceae bacterium]
MPSRLAKDFESFADLAAAYAAGQDYRIVAVPRPLSSTAIVAPHGGGIEAYTSDIARGIAGDDYGLYVFEGLLRAGNFAALHLSSERFDEPECLRMLGECDRVVSVHGCGAPGEVVWLGGRDQALRDAVFAQLRAAGIECDDAPAALAGAGPRNVCNRGRTGRGVQLEVSIALRRSRQRTALVRSALQG